MQISEAQSIARSFRDEERLIDERDVNALWYSYRYTGLQRVANFLPILLAQDNSKTIGSICVERSVYSEITAIGDCRWIDGACTVTSLHFPNDKKGGPAPGLQQARSSLGAVAQDMIANPRTYRENLVLAATYSELLGVVTKIGFRRMNLLSATDGLMDRTRASHKVFCALNGRRWRPFVIQAAYLEQAEFIDRFAPFGEPN